MLGAGTTTLLQEAARRGCRYQVGTDMLFEQIPAYLEFFGYGNATPDELRAVARISYQSLYEGSSRSASRRQAAQSLPPFRKLPASMNWLWAYSQASLLGIV